MRNLRRSGAALALSLTAVAGASGAVASSASAATASGATQSTHWVQLGQTSHGTLTPHGNLLMSDNWP